jgi:hypothetical protein
MVTFWPAEVVSVKPDADTLVAVPTEPPAAGPDRALDPVPVPEAPANPWLLPLLLVLPLPLAVVAVPLPAVPATIPWAPPAITIAAIPDVMTLDRLLENILLSPRLSC